MNINFQVVDKNSDHFHLVTKLFNTRIKALYGVQDSAVAKIKDAKDRICEILFVDQEPKGLIVFKNALQAGDVLELKTLSLLDPEKDSGKGYGTLLLDRVMFHAVELDARDVLLTVSSSGSSLPFFSSKGFTIVNKYVEKYMKDATEYELKAAVKSYKHKVTTSSRGEVRTSAAASSSTVITDMISQPKRIFYVGGFRPQDHSLPRTVFSCTLQRKYIDLINSGRKTIEGRVNTKFFESYKVGAQVRWFGGGTSAMTKITSRKTYSTFRAMLEDVGYKNCIPDARDLEHAVRIYADIPGYAEKVNRFGALALGVEVITPAFSATRSSRDDISGRDNHRDERRDHHRGERRDYDGEGRGGHKRERSRDRDDRDRHNKRHCR